MILCAHICAYENGLYTVVSWRLSSCDLRKREHDATLKINDNQVITNRQTDLVLIKMNKNKQKIFLHFFCFYLFIYHS